LIKSGKTELKSDVDEKASIKLLSF